MEDICDIAACEFVAKPAPDAFKRMTDRHGVAPAEAAMFEDMPHNLEAAHALGMTTVLVHSDYLDHPAQAARCAPGRSCRSTSIMRRMI